MLTDWLDEAINALRSHFPDGTFFSFDIQIRGLIAVLLVSCICGAVGSLVVGNRMAFFSDALSHCAFAGVAGGFLLALLFGVRGETAIAEWLTAFMVSFGILVGLGIFWVRDRSDLSNDTVIAVFFAGAIGFGAILIKFISRRSRYFSPENFLFGDATLVTSADLVRLFLLFLLTGGVLAWLFNHLVLASFNPSLARSRRVPIRLSNLVFIVLLAVVVNLCLQTVGVLLINAMLVVPAATAANLCRNLRQLFWSTVGLCLLVGVAGEAISWNLTVYDSAHGGEGLSFSVGGIMVVLSVLLFFLSLLARPYLRKA